MERFVLNLERDEHSLEEKIKRREMEIQRARRKLEIIGTGRNKERDEEIERLEREANKAYD